MMLAKAAKAAKPKYEKGAFSSSVFTEI